MKEQIFITVAEAADMLGISKSHAYKIVRDLNRDMKAMGYLTTRTLKPARRCWWITP